MYIPPHRCNNSEECEGETHRWLSSPITPEEHELLFRSQQQKKEEEDTHKYYYWNDIPTLQTKMLEYLPRHYKDCEIFTPSQQQQQQQTLMDHVSYMEFRQPKTRLCKAYRVTLAYVQEKQWSHSPVHVQFFQGLLDCPPMQLGFHTLAVPGWCFCPLSLPAWCHKHRLGHLLEKARANYCHCERRSPNAFMDHVRDMQKPSQPVLLLRELHNLLQVFLEAYYDRYGDAHHSHHAMYPLQSDKYNHVMGRKFARLQRLLELGFEQRQRWQQETLAQQKKLQELQQVKQILKNVLHQEEVEWWEKQQSLFQHARGVLGIQTTAQERQPYGRIPYQACRQTYLSRVEEILVDHCLQTTGTQVRKVTLGGSSFRAMKRLWKKRDHPYLFEDSISDLEESFFVGMDASPHSDNPEKDQGKAKDEGGPTRQFLSELWRYLPRIVLQTKDKNGKEMNLALFTQTDHYLQPKSNDEIDPVQEYGKKVAHRCYRALGRILGFCILHEYHISNNVLSKFHRNYLLRGITPKDGYDKADLFYDLKESMGQENNDNKQIFNNLQAFLESKDETDFETKLRNHVHDIYIDQNTFFLNAIKEGMQLDFIESDRIPQIFRDIHSWRLDELLFGKTTFDVEDVIASLHPVYADLREFPEFSPDPETPARVVIQKMVLRKNEMNKAEGALVNVIRSLGKDNQDFLATFVLYVTGYDYLPVAVPIHIEFNHYESGSNVHLPVAHTCDHVLKLPGLAYNADEDLIRTRLTTSLRYFKDSKSAFNRA